MITPGYFGENKVAGAEFQISPVTLQSHLIFCRRSSRRRSIAISRVTTLFAHVNAAGGPEGPLFEARAVIIDDGIAGDVTIRERRFDPQPVLRSHDERIHPQAVSPL